MSTPTNEAAADAYHEASDLLTILSAATRADPPASADAMTAPIERVRALVNKMGSYIDGQPRD